MLRIWGRRNSVNVQKVMWCVGELGLEHERIDAGREFGKTRDGWYLAMNPNGLVPVIDDDGFTLWESNTVVRYLSAKHGGLCPQSAQARADAEKWMDWQITTLLPPMSVLFWGMVRPSAVDYSKADLDKAADQAGQAFRILDRQLEGRDFVLGSSLTMADIPVGAMAYRWHTLELIRPDHPNLRDWYRRLTERDAFRAHVMIPLT